jgi:hypothetical protein
MQRLLETCTPAQINLLIEVLQAVQPRNTESAAPNAAGSTESSPEEYQQRMSWQLRPARGDDEEKLPTACSPLHSGRDTFWDLRTFTEIFTTTPLGVDDLVKHCHEVGNAMAESNSAPNTKPRSMQRPAWQLGLV